jgi:hypothetical protein
VPPRLGRETVAELAFQTIGDMSRVGQCSRKAERFLPGRRPPKKLDFVRRPPRAAKCLQAHGLSESWPLGQVSDAMSRDHIAWAAYTTLGRECAPPHSMATTQYSLTDDPTRLGRPTGFRISVNEVWGSADRRCLGLVFTSRSFGVLDGGRSAHHGLRDSRDERSEH